MLKELEAKTIEYFEKEYVNAIRAKDRHIAEPLEIVHNARQRMFGVVEFCLSFGVEIDFLEKQFNDYVDRLEAVILQKNT